MSIFVCYLRYFINTFDPKSTVFWIHSDFLKSDPTNSPRSLCPVSTLIPNLWKLALAFQHYYFKPFSQNLQSNTASIISIPALQSFWRIFKFSHQRQIPNSTGLQCTSTALSTTFKIKLTHSWTKYQNQKLSSHKIEIYQEQKMFTFFYSHQQSLDYSDTFSNENRVFNEYIWSNPLARLAFVIDSFFLWIQWILKKRKKNENWMSILKI